LYIEEGINKGQSLIKRIREREPQDKEKRAFTKEKKSPTKKTAKEFVHTERRGKQ